MLCIVPGEKSGNTMRHWCRQVIRKLLKCRPPVFDGPNKGSGRYSSGADTKCADKVGFGISRFSNGLTLLSVSCGPKDGGSVEAGGVFAVPVVAAAVEDDGGNAGLGD